MAFSAAVFGAGHPIYSAIAATFFAAVDTLGIRAQLRFGDIVSQHFLLMLPYIATIAGIWLSAHMRKGSSHAMSTELRDR
jgi:ABC-type uncharacterized transport system permease subunit